MFQWDDLIEYILDYEFDEGKKLWKETVQVENKSSHKSYLNNFRHLANSVFHKNMR